MNLLKALNEDNIINCKKAIQYNIQNKIPLTESVFRPGSDMFIIYFKYLKENMNTLKLSSDIIDILNSNLGSIGTYEDKQIPLDLPFINEEEVELNKPKRGGSKKYYVYVKDPDTGKIKKISFGQKGMSVKINDKQAAKAFAARHNCDSADKQDKNTPGYWACRLPKYAELVGLTGGGNYYW